MSGGEMVHPVVQVLGSKMIPASQGSGERYRLLISDGIHLNSFAMLATQHNSKITSGELSENSIIKITNHIVSVVKNTGKGDKRIMVILEMEILKRGSEVGHRIGNPAPFTEGARDNTQQETAQHETPQPSSDVKPNGEFIRRITVESLQNLANYSRRSINDTTLNSPMNTTMTHPIISLSPYQNNWVIKARVTSKTAIRHWSNARSEGKLFSMDLVDESGEIRATAFKDQVDKFYDMIEEGKVYFISKCTLKMANKKFTTINNDYEMTFTNDTKVVPCMEDDTSIPSLKFNFVNLNLILDSQPGDMIDFIGICQSTADLVSLTSKTTNRELKKRDITLVDRSLASINLTLWGTQAEDFCGDGQPVIAVKGGKVSDFGGGRSVSLVSSSVLQLNPDIPEAHRLRGWYDCLTEDVKFNSLSTRGGETGSGGKWYTLGEATLLQLGCGDKADYFNCYATLMHVRTEKSVYKACPTPDCQKKVIDQNNGMYRCEKCNREFENFKYRLMLSANIGDYSGNQWVTLFQDAGEELLGIKADEVGKLQEESDSEYNEVFKKVTLMPYQFRLRAKMETFNDESRVKITVFTVKKPDYKERCTRLINEIKEMSGMGSCTS
ncbi:hypothetical protein AAG570_009862 [Ranatra chinensis]|uniref:Replication protein A subunit n=1 Tax=Ranatra chinensis TaxID=642074 RepID=A0ABD0YQB1_9HEMI